ncbi:MAG: hypothetical protein RPU39_10855 [Candidatus Sedimenticola sp. (ex Thyasira tokunagai)]
MREELIIHIGYPKTASTWLQESVFNCGEYGLVTPWSDCRSLAVSSFILANPYSFEPDSARAVFSGGVKEVNSEGKAAVISDETLGGDPLRPWINSRVIADRLKLTFPEARILICIREQKSAIHSLYSEYIKHGHTATLKEFIGATGGCVGRAPICDVVQLEYDMLIHHYQTLFGRERVAVLTFEDFIANKNIFLNKLFHSVNVDIDLSGHHVDHEIKNPSLGPVTLNIRRHFNKYTRKPDWTRKRQPFSFIINQKISNLFESAIPNYLQKSARIENNKMVSEFIGDRYCESNRRTMEFTGLDLAGLGYSV